MCKRGVISEAREQSLRHFAFDADCIIHEAGVPPIHTPISTLLNLPQSVKKKLHVVHCSTIPDFAQDELSIPRCGLENTIRLDVGARNDGYGLALRRAKMLSEIRFLRFVSPLGMFSLLENLDTIRLLPDSVLAVDAKSFFLVEDGHPSVCFSDDSTRALSPGDSFGEHALVHAEAVSEDDIAPTFPVTVTAGSSTATLIVLSPSALRVLWGSPFADSVSSEVLRASEHVEFVKQVLSRTFLFEGLPSSHISGRLSCGHFCNYETLLC
jgi:hypothetical protein